MEKLKRLRAPVRASITRTLDVVNIELEEDDPSYDVLENSKEKLQDLKTQVCALDNKILEALAERADDSDDEISTESMSSEQYTDKIRIALRRIDNLRLAAQPQNVIAREDADNRLVAVDRKKAYKLPKIEIMKFNGELIEWLPFWSQFQRIHNDRELDNVDKFQYLSQCMIEGTRACDLVKGYPQSEINYPKVISALQERFGRPKLLKQVYVRELLKMVVSNARTEQTSKLTKMFDKLESHLRALESLGITSEQTAEFLYPMVESSLPEDILIAWQRSSYYGKDGSLEDPPLNEMDYLMRFLRAEVESEEQRLLARTSFLDASVNKQAASKSGKTKKEKSSEDIPTAFGIVAGQVGNCLFCDKPHASQECLKAQRLSLSERREKVKEKNHCFACLKPNHSAKNCKTLVKCIVCGRKHYTLMCGEVKTKDRVYEVQPAIESKKEMVQTSMTSQVCPSNILLMTCLVRVRGFEGAIRVCRVLFDSGSHLTRIRSSVVESLRIKPISNRTLRTAVYGGGIITAPHSLFNLLIESLDGKESRRIEAYDEKTLCGALLPRIPKGPWLEELNNKGINFNDCRSANEDIDVIIGSQHFQKMLTGHRVESQYGYTAVETVFGWTLCGVLHKAQDVERSSAMVITSMSINEADVSQLWELESIGIKDPIEATDRSNKNLQLTENLVKTLSRKEDGRYSVCLPWKEEELMPPVNRRIAEKRLESVTSKLEKTGQLDIYNNLFEQWYGEGFIESIPEQTENRVTHYLPHRPVFKPSSVTTPVRPVFDASCRVGKEPSLNDCLEKGPNYIELIPPILIRFRKERFGVSADIRKAFQMIEVSAEDRDALRFLWWENISSERRIRIFRHRRVVFGVNCSPFILGAVLDQHFRSVGEEDKRCAERLRKSMYVDNFITSLSSLEEYLEFKNQATKILADCQMQLRQWECSFQVEKTGIVDNTNEISTVLGMNWNKRLDTLSCNVIVEELPEKITKRVVLSMVQRIFDPLGLVCPVTITPKLLLRQSWLQKRGWDEEISTEDSSIFRKWYRTLSHLSGIEIPRYVNYPKGGDGEAQLHIFCDASKDATAATVFLRVKSSSGIFVQLIQAKSRIAPKKEITMPCMELLACSIAARLGTSVKLAFEEEIRTYYWTDSSVALAWIQRENVWKVFIRNRVKEINSLTEKADWRHVSGINNPADLPSRGCTALQVKNSRWWEGPPWLRTAPESWPVIDDAPNEELVEAGRPKTLNLNLIAAGSSDWYVRTSSYVKCVRVMAYVLRFIKIIRERHHTRDKVARVRSKEVVNRFSSIDDISGEEFDAAEKMMIRLVQGENFPKEGDIVNNLRVMRDSDNIIRVTTRLILSDDEEDFRYPILLPHSHSLVALLIRQKHVEHCHAGLQFLMSKLRENYWILRGRRTVGKVIRDCVICKRYSSSKPTVPVPPLPRDRIRRTAPFDVTGIDLAGPLYLRHHEKAWIVIFTCAVYRCVHLELTNSLSTETFLLAFYRFVSRRRRPSIIYSDNGTNFTGAARLFAKLNWKKITRDSQLQRIIWKFNPPSAAWWGGWWERLIGMVKSLLRRMLGHSKLTYVQLETCVCEVEAVLNSRPLTYVSEEQQDLIPLTPAKFLGEAAETVTYPEEETLRAPFFRQKYKKLIKIREELRIRFKKEYLALMVQKGTEKRHRVFKVGEVVLVASDNLKRIAWPMAVIKELLPGKDGHVRVARIKMKNGEFVRPIQRLYPLEISDTTDLTDNGEDSSKELEPVERVETSKYVTRSGREVKKPERYQGLSLFSI